MKIEEASHIVAQTADALRDGDSRVLSVSLYTLSALARAGHADVLYQIASLMSQISMALIEASESTDGEIIH